jgi:signal transduction histidine kinase
VTLRAKLAIIIGLMVATVLVLAGALVWVVHRGERELARSQLAFGGYDAAVQLGEALAGYGAAIVSLQVEEPAAAGGVRDLRATEARAFRLITEIQGENSREREFVGSDDEDEEAREEKDEATVLRELHEGLDFVRLKVHAAEEARAKKDEKAVGERVREATKELDGQVAARLTAYREDESEQVSRARASAAAYADLSRWLGLLISIMAVVCAGLAVGSAYLLRTMSSRIHDLSAGTRELAAGNLAYRLADAGEDELSSLARDFNRMGEQIGKLNAELDERADRIEQAYAFQKDFFAMMTHELRAPLSSILGFCELIAEDEPAMGATAKENLAWIETSARRMMERVNSILTLAKLEAGRLEVDIRPFKLRALLEEVAREGRGHIKSLGRAVEVKLTIAEDIPAEIRSDKEKLRHILANFVSNAAKHTESGAIGIEAKAVGDSRVSIAVSDTGVGIEVSRLESIFELYTVGERRGSGTGIGLALARRFARLLGGEVRVSSEVGEGSTFTVELGDAPEPEPEQKVE